MSVRSAVALERGATEEMLTSVDRYEESDLTPEQQAALKLADAYLVAPAEMTDSTKRDVTAHLSTEQILELALKLMGFSSDKVTVALGLDIDEVTVISM